MTVKVGHGIKYVGNPEDVDKPFEEVRLMAVEVACPGDECWDCNTEQILEAMRTGVFRT